MNHTESESPRAGGNASPFLLVPEVASMLHASEYVVRQLAADGRLPHRKLPGARRLLFREDELLAAIDGAALERVDLADGGRVVRLAKGPAR
jgi:predicted DNA-binding transcriptional regulator AlpA